MFFNWATITTLLGILGWVIAIAMLFIVPVNRKPSSATAWLLLIFLVPYFGLILSCCWAAQSCQRAAEPSSTI